MDQLRLKLAYSTLLESTAHAPPSSIRDLILEVDLIAGSFGVAFDDRESIACADEDLDKELIVTAASLVKVSEDLHDGLLEEIENLLARNVPHSCFFYIVRSKLWETDSKAWARLVGLMLFHVKDPESFLPITAVIAQRIPGGEGIDEA